MVPVGLLAIGEKAEVQDVGQRIPVGCSCEKDKSTHAACIRLEDMGLRAGQIVEMLNNEGKGPVLLKVDNSRIAIDRRTAMKIMVAIEGK